MITLYIETSGQVFYTAVSEQDRLLFEKLEEQERDLPRQVETALSAAGLTHDKVAQIVCGTGPGSFTGLRIGLGYAKGLALGLQIPIRTAPSLESAIAAYSDTAIAVADARKGEFFVATNQSSSQLMSESQLRPLLEQTDRVIWFGATAQQPEIFANYSVQGLQDLWRGLSAKGQSIFSSVADISGIIPLYGRPVSAKSISERIKLGLLPK